MWLRHRRQQCSCQIHHKWGSALCELLSLGLNTYTRMIQTTTFLEIYTDLTSCFETFCKCIDHSFIKFRIDEMAEIEMKFLVWSCQTLISLYFYGCPCSFVQCVSKKFPPFNSLQLCQILTEFLQNFCSAEKRMKFATKPISQYQSHLKARCYTTSGN